MSSTAWILLAVTGVVAAVDWVAVVTEKKPLEYIAKPAVMIGLIAVALALTPFYPDQRAWFVAALALGMVGDVFLMLRRDLFLAGLGAFLLGHLAYIAGFLSAGPRLDAVALLSLMALLPGVVVMPQVTRGIRAQGRDRLVGPVLLYALAITVMLGFAMASGRRAAQLGGLLFYASDTMISVHRFVSPRRWLPLAIIVAYHAGQALLVLSLVR